MDADLLQPALVIVYLDDDLIGVSKPAGQACHPIDFDEPGDVVLLSPACTSFDHFRNFEERGRYFKEIVSQLE